MGWPPVVTHRHLLTWDLWFADEWNKPTRSDYYAMQIASEVRAVLCGFAGGEMPHIDDFVLPFGTKKEEAPLPPPREVAGPVPTYSSSPSANYDSIPGSDPVVEPKPVPKYDPATQALTMSQLSWMNRVGMDPKQVKQIIQRNLGRTEGS